jgi:hypothetical protein
MTAMLTTPWTMLPWRTPPAHRRGMACLTSGTNCWGVGAREAVGGGCPGSVGGWVPGKRWVGGCPGSVGVKGGPHMADDTPFGVPGGRVGFPHPGWAGRRRLSRGIAPPPLRLLQAARPRRRLRRRLICPWTVLWMRGRAASAGGAGAGAGARHRTPAPLPPSAGGAQVLGSCCTLLRPRQGQPAALISCLAAAGRGFAATVGC